MPNYTLTEDAMSNLMCCPIDNTFKLIGKKFTIHILRNMMMQQQSRFNEFLDSVEGINPKTLSARLREMEASGLIKRIVFGDSSPVRVEYHLTEKGHHLRSILEQMATFSLQHCSCDILKDGKPRTLKEMMNVAPTIIK